MEARSKVPAPACRCCGADLGPARRFAGVDRHHGLPGRFGVAVCPSCGAGCTLPLVEPEDLAALYPEAYEAYDLPPAGPARAASAVIRRWQAFLALRTAPIAALRRLTPGWALDVGCGRGDLGAALLGAGWRVTGVEPSAAACAVARGRGIDARRGTLAEVELEHAAYDAASFRHSLEHVTDPVADLRRVHDALRPGGLVLVTVPHFGGWQARRFRSRWYHLDLPRHRIHFTAAGLARALERAGLQPMRLSTATSTIGLPASVQYALAGRCLFPTGLPLRAASAAAAAAWPLALAADRLGGGDLLHAVARRP